MRWMFKPTDGKHLFQFNRLKLEIHHRWLTAGLTLICNKFCLIKSNPIRIKYIYSEVYIWTLKLFKFISNLLSMTGSSN